MLPLTATWGAYQELESGSELMSQLGTPYGLRGVLLLPLISHFTLYFAGFRGVGGGGRIRYMSTFHVFISVIGANKFTHIIYFICTYANLSGLVISGAKCLFNYSNIQKYEVTRFLYLNIKNNISVEDS